MLEQPRVEMHINSSIPFLQHAPPVRFLQLILENAVSPIGLLLESLVRIFVVGRMVVAEPIALSGHRAQRADKEEDPLVEVDFVLFARAGTELAVFVVDAEDVVDYGSGLPRYDACVGVFECRDLPRRLAGYLFSLCGKLALLCRSH